MTWATTAAALAPDSSDIKSPQRSGRRWRYRLMMAALGLLLIGLFRFQILGALAAPLVFSDTNEFTGPAVLLHQSKPFYDEAVTLYLKALATQILVLQKPPTRVEQLGIAGSAEQASALLSARGIPERRQAVILCKDRRAWCFAEALLPWLKEHPESRLTLVCDRFESRRARLILDRVLAREDQDRVRVYPLADPRFDENNWWERKEGRVEFFKGYVELVYSYLNGNTGQTEPDLSPHAYVSLSGSNQ
jgi:hypothetical protein